MLRRFSRVSERVERVVLPQRNLLDATAKNACNAAKYTKYLVASAMTPRARAHRRPVDHTRSIRSDALFGNQPVFEQPAPVRDQIETTMPTCDLVDYGFHGAASRNQ